MHCISNVGVNNKFIIFIKQTVEFLNQAKLIKVIFKVLIKKGLK